jgi:uncharacterized protein involved in exopolysaccharide biosynthesis
MALKVQIAPPTPRDRLDRLLDYVRRALRYWWVVLLFMVLGGALSVAFALTRPPLFQSGAVLFYQERIQSVVLQGRDAATVQRNIGERYRELLLARSSLAQIIKDPKLNPYPEVVASDGEDMAVEELRLAVSFDTRGANTFRITFAHTDPEIAKRVTERLTELLLAKESAIRSDQARETVKFAEDQQKAAQEEMNKRRRALAEFLAAHPEFAQDALEGSSEGAAVRAQHNRPATPISTTNPRLLALDRQRIRIRARLEAGNNPQPAARTPRAPSAEQIAADNLVRETERELAAAQRELESALSRYTERHPDVLKAREAVTSAQQRLRRAQAAVPRGDDDTPLPPPTAVDRAALERELAEVERALNAERARERAATGAPAPAVSEADTATNWVVQLETEHGSLRQSLEEQRDRVESLADSVFRAQMQANQQVAEGGSNLTVVDPAFEPKQPQGKGKRVLVLAGLVLFTGLGMMLALGLGIIDDRLYRRIDVEQLELAPVLAVIPKAKARPRRASRPPRSSGTSRSEAASDG